MKEKLLGELTGKRKRCVKYFQMTEKGVAAAVYPEPVHYEEDGEWKDIDNRLEAVTEEVTVWNPPWNTPLTQDRSKRSQT